MDIKRIKAALSLSTEVSQEFGVSIDGQVGYIQCFDRKFFNGIPVDAKEQARECEQYPVQLCKHYKGVKFIYLLSASEASEGEPDYTECPRCNGGLYPCDCENGFVTEEEYHRIVKEQDEEREDYAAYHAEFKSEMRGEKA